MSEVFINGESVTITKPTMTLLEYLRECRHTGTKEGCADGDCGACTVAVVGQDAEGKLHYQAMNSCIMPLGSLSRREVITVEGISNSQLHPVQEAMVRTAGSQCGYCTPGFIMSMFAAYYDGKVDDSSIEGNLCRCTGYLPIRKAGQALGVPEADDVFVKRLQERRGEEERGRRGDAEGSSLSTLLPFSSSSEFVLPQALNEVFAELEAHPTATLIAGGTDLGLELSHHRKRFDVLVSLENVAELKVINDTHEVLEIGAGVTLTHIEKKLHGIFPALDEMLHWFAARQVRNRATIGGNLGTASPIGDLPPVLLSLDASVKLASKNSERIVPISDFFTGYRQTAMQKNELIVSVRIPKLLERGAVKRFSQSYKVAKRGSDDISTVSASFAIDLDRNDSITKARLAYGGVAAVPARALDAEAVLTGKRWNEKSMLLAKEKLKTAFTPLSDFRGSAQYRNMLVANLLEKFFIESSEVVS
jgi:xanthine dehydrogenase small subunit